MGSRLQQDVSFQWQCSRLFRHVSIGICSQTRPNPTLPYLSHFLLRLVHLEKAPESRKFFVWQRSESRFLGEMRTEFEEFASITEHASRLRWHYSIPRISLSASELGIIGSSISGVKRRIKPIPKKANREPQSHTVIDQRLEQRANILVEGFNILHSATPVTVQSGVIYFQIWETYLGLFRRLSSLGWQLRRETRTKFLIIMAASWGILGSEKILRSSSLAYDR